MKALQILFYHPSSGANHSDMILARLIGIRCSRSHPSSSYFPFCCFTSWDILMSPVLFGSCRTPGSSAQSWHGRRSINICGMDNESWIIIINHPQTACLFSTPKAVVLKLFGPEPKFQQGKRRCSSLILLILGYGRRRHVTRLRERRCQSCFWWKHWDEASFH